MSEFVVPPLSRKEIKRLASTVRERFGLDRVALCPVIDMVEYVLPALDPKFNYEIVDDAELGMDQANYNPNTHIMKIRNSVYNNACNGNGRDRFTIAHEIGHFFLHSEVDLALSRIENHSAVPAYRNSEWQANAFASAFLMPDHIIAPWEPHQIAKFCGTSMSAAEIAYKQKKR